MLRHESEEMDLAEYPEKRMLRHMPGDILQRIRRYMWMLRHESGDMYLAEEPEMQRCWDIKPKTWILYSILRREDAETWARRHRSIGAVHAPATAGPGALAGDSIPPSEPVGPSPNPARHGPSGAWLQGGCGKHLGGHRAVLRVHRRAPVPWPSRGGGGGGRQLAAPCIWNTGPPQAFKGREIHCKAPPGARILVVGVFMRVLLFFPLTAQVLIAAAATVTQPPRCTAAATAATAAKASTAAAKKGSCICWRISSLQLTIHFCSYFELVESGLTSKNFGIIRGWD